MACFCAAGIAHFCKLPRLPSPQPAIKNSPTRLCRFLPGQQIAPVFLRYAFFQHKSAVLQNCTHFCIFHLFAKISTFLRTAILRAFLAFLFSRLPFQKTVSLLRVSKIRLYFNHTKRGGIFHFKPPKQHLKLKFIFLKSTQNLWKGFWENLTMCHILPHFAGKQCAFFN